MRLIQIDHNPSKRQLNLFGVIWLVFFGIIGGIVLERSGSLAAATALWGFAVLIPMVGWILPAFMRVVFIGMAYAGFPIGFIISHLIMLIVYYVVLTPIGLLMRLFGYDPMNRRFDVSAQTYWCPREQDDSLKRYFRQF